MSYLTPRSAVHRLSTLIGLVVLLLLSPASAIPQRRGRNRNGNGNGATRQTAQQQAARVADGISAATDGSVILDQTVNIKYELSNWDAL